MVPYIGDFAIGSVISCTFNSFTTAAVEDEPYKPVESIAPSGASAIVFLNGSSSVGSASVSLSAGGVGANKVSVSTSGYSAGDYFIKVSCTIDGGSINAFVGHFSLENRINSDSDAILKFLFASLAGHGLHVLIKDPSTFSIALSECQRLWDNLPASQKWFAGNLLPFFERYLETLK